MVQQSYVGNAQRSALHHWTVLTVGVGLVLFAGVLYGNYSQRWGPPADLVAAGSHLESFPDQLGNWVLTEDLPMSDGTLAMLECAGHVNRRYLNQESGETISVAIIVGPPGPTAVHTPEICFSSRAYTLSDSRRTVVIGAVPAVEHSLWCVEFKTQNILADELRVYYAWSRGERWEASASPRVEFAAAPLLYKIQLAATISPNTKEVDSDPCRHFLEALIASDWAIDAKRMSALDNHR
jgi:hypothetical protein